MFNRIRNFKKLYIQQNSKIINCIIQKFIEYGNYKGNYRLSMSFYLEKT